MSIIYDALKKAEDKKMADEKKPTPPSPKKGQNKIIIIVFTVAVIFAVSYKVLPYLKKYIPWPTSFKKEKTKGVSQTKNKSVSQSVSKKETSPTPEPLPKKTYPQGSYLLEGIIYGQDTPVAVINGQVLEKDQIFDDIKVIEITPTTVQILNIKTNTHSTLTL